MSTQSLLRIPCIDGYVYCPIEIVNFINYAFLVHANTSSMIAVGNAVNHLLDGPNVRSSIAAKNMCDLHDTLMFAQKINYVKLLASLDNVFKIIVDADFG